jgi:hypothetical protein
MAERSVSVEFVFDRTGAQTLAQAYRMLVPERRARAAMRRDTDGEQPADKAISTTAGTQQLVAGERRALGACARRGYIPCVTMA